MGRLMPWGPCPPTPQFPLKTVSSSLSQPEPGTGHLHFYLCITHVNHYTQGATLDYNSHVTQPHAGELHTHPCTLHGGQKQLSCHLPPLIPDTLHYHPHARLPVFPVLSTPDVGLSLGMGRSGDRNRFQAYSVFSPHGAFISLRASPPPLRLWTGAGMPGCLESGSSRQESLLEGSLQPAAVPRGQSWYCIVPAFAAFHSQWPKLGWGCPRTRPRKRSLEQRGSSCFLLICPAVL